MGDIAKTKDWSPAQVCLVWSRQHGVSSLVGVGSSSTTSSSFETCSPFLSSSTVLAKDEKIEELHDTPDNETHPQSTLLETNLKWKTKMQKYQERMNENLLPYVCDDCNKYIVHGEMGSVCERKNHNDQMKEHCRYRFTLSKEEMERIGRIHLSEGCLVKFAWDPKNVK